MLISVLISKPEAKQDFEELWAFYKSFVNDDHGMMQWQILKNSNGTLSRKDPNSATDGDMDVAYALFKAGWLSCGIDPNCTEQCTMNGLLTTHMCICI